MPLGPSLSAWFLWTSFYLELLEPDRPNRSKHRLRKHRQITSNSITQNAPQYCHHQYHSCHMLRNSAQKTATTTTASILAWFCASRTLYMNICWKAGPNASEKGRAGLHGLLVQCAEAKVRAVGMLVCPCFLFNFVYGFTMSYYPTNSLKILKHKIRVLRLQKLRYLEIKLISSVGRLDVRCDLLPELQWFNGGAMRSHPTIWGFWGQPKTLLQLQLHPPPLQASIPITSHCGEDRQNHHLGESQDIENDI